MGITSPKNYSLMNFSSSIFGVSVDYICLFLVLIYALIVLFFGFLTAFSGRQADAKKRELIERVVFSFWCAVVPFFFKMPYLSPFCAVAGAVFASYVSDGYKRFIFPVITSIALFLFLFPVLAIYLAIDIFSIAGFSIILFFLFIGYQIGKKYQDWSKIIATTYAGSSMFASGILAITFLFQEKSWIFIKNALVTSLIPLIGGIFEDVTWYESLIYWSIFLLISVVGFLNQRDKYLMVKHTTK